MVLDLLERGGLPAFEEAGQLAGSPCAGRGHAAASVTLRATFRRSVGEAVAVGRDHGDASPCPGPGARPSGSSGRPRPVMAKAGTCDQLAQDVSAGTSMPHPPFASGQAREVLSGQTRHLKADPLALDRRPRVGQHLDAGRRLPGSERTISYSFLAAEGDRPGGDDLGATATAERDVEIRGGDTDARRHASSTRTLERIGMEFLRSTIPCTS